MGERVPRWRYWYSVREVIRKEGEKTVCECECGDDLVGSDAHNSNLKAYRWWRTSRSKHPQKFHPPTPTPYQPPPSPFPAVPSYAHHVYDTFTFILSSSNSARSQKAYGRVLYIGKTGDMFEKSPGTRGIYKRFPEILRLGYILLD